MKFNRSGKVVKEVLVEVFGKQHLGFLASSLGVSRQSIWRALKQDEVPLLYYYAILFLIEERQNEDCDKQSG